MAYKFFLVIYYLEVELLVALLVAGPLDVGGDRVEAGLLQLCQAVVPQRGVHAEVVDAAADESENMIFLVI